MFLGVCKMISSNSFLGVEFKWLPNRKANGFTSLHRFYMLGSNCVFCIIGILWSVLDFSGAGKGNVYNLIFNACAGFNYIYFSKIWLYWYHTGFIFRYLPSLFCRLIHVVTHSFTLFWRNNSRKIVSWFAKQSRNHEWPEE